MPCTSGIYLHMVMSTLRDLEVVQLRVCLRCSVNRSMTDVNLWINFRYYTSCCAYTPESKTYPTNTPPSTPSSASGRLWCALQNWQPLQFHLDTALRNITQIPAATDTPPGDHLFQGHLNPTSCSKRVPSSERRRCHQPAHISHPVCCILCVPKKASSRSTESHGAGLHIWDCLEASAAFQI